jgi:hypothetical protein
LESLQTVWSIRKSADAGLLESPQRPDLAETLQQLSTILSKDFDFESYRNMPRTLILRFRIFQEQIILKKLFTGCLEAEVTQLPY